MQHMAANRAFSRPQILDRSPLADHESHQLVQCQKACLIPDLGLDPLRSRIHVLGFSFHPSFHQRPTILKICRSVTSENSYAGTPRKRLHSSSDVLQSSKTPICLGSFFSMCKGSRRRQIGDHIHAVSGSELGQGEGPRSRGGDAEFETVAPLDPDTLWMEAEEEEYRRRNADSSGSGENGEYKGMAEAFQISQKTAFGITSSISFAALLLPFLMRAWAPAAPLNIKIVTYITLLLGFYMAWNIGANDVANAMGTSVGSGALTLRQAVLTAAILEFSGAFLVGSHVSHTMQSGILKADIFAGRQQTLLTGMLSSLAAAGTWLQVASFFGWPVSTTHCIIGAMVGFGLVFGGVNAIYWGSLTRVVSSWAISPVLGALISYLVYRSIRMFVYSSSNPGQAASATAPFLVFSGITALSFSALVGSGNILWVFLQSIACGTVGAVVVSVLIDRQIGPLVGDYCEVPAQKGESAVRSPKGPTGTQLQIVYSVFGYLQVLSACFMSFAHGANDVANAIGPIAAALALLNGSPMASVGVPTAVLAWGGFGIVAGLLVWGYRVIATIGKRITELTPTRGFAAEFAAATVVVVASRMGLPISATHTLVGAVMGVGFARGLNSVRGDVVAEIVASWLVTIPIGAALSVFYAFIISKLLPPLL